MFHFGEHDELTERIAGTADQAIRLPDSIQGMRDVIASQTLDLLYYPDVGMGPETYFLAFSRLATVQCVTWGHRSRPASRRLTISFRVRIWSRQDRSIIHRATGSASTTVDLLL